MEIYQFELTPADRKANLDYEKIESEHRIFSIAATNCTNGVSFKRDGKQLKICNITPSSILLTLTSVAPLTSPKRTLSAFSRELIRLDKESNLLSESIYNHTLFNVTSISIGTENKKTINDITNSDLLKTMVDLLYTPWIESEAERTTVINSIKETLLPYMSK